MKAQVTKKLINDGRELQVGDIVDVSTWRNTKSLESSRYIKIVSDNEPLTVFEDDPIQEVAPKIEKEAKSKVFGKKEVIEQPVQEVVEEKDEGKAVEPLYDQELDKV